ncbi:MAG: hypothetical protein QNK43_05755, partial [Amphritea sp.]|nr:hypothetical protein [Amphritea sp.]
MASLIDFYLTLGDRQTMNKHGFFHRFIGSCHQRKGDRLVKRATKKLGLDAEQQDKLSHFNQQFQHSKADIETVRR